MSRTCHDLHMSRIFSAPQGLWLCGMEITRQVLPAQPNGTAGSLSGLPLPLTTLLAAWVTMHRVACLAKIVCA